MCLFFVAVCLFLCFCCCCWWWWWWWYLWWYFWFGFFSFGVVVVLGEGRVVCWLLLFFVLFFCFVVFILYYFCFVASSRLCVCSPLTAIGRLKSWSFLCAREAFNKVTHSQVLDLLYSPYPHSPSSNRSVSLFIHSIFLCLLRLSFQTFLFIGSPTPSILLSTLPLPNYAQRILYCFFLLLFFFFFFSVHCKWIDIITPPHPFKDSALISS